MQNFTCSVLKILIFLPGSNGSFYSTITIFQAIDFVIGILYF